MDKMNEQKVYIDKDVYTAAQERIQYLFDEFDNLLVAFSGGKDSTVCLNMIYDYAKEHDCLSKVGMMHVDYEAQYQMTTDYVTDCFLNKFDGIRKYWLCFPISAQCACRMDGPYWTPWDKEDQDKWVRQMPDNEYVLNEDNSPFPVIVGETDYEMQERFGNWYAEQYGKTAVIIGIRADESLNRYRTIVSLKKVNDYKGTNYIVKHGYAYNAYPIYDWTVEDIWTYMGKFGKSYNKLYDLFFQAGLSVNQMRVASPFNDCAMDSLKYYKVIDPDNWGRMVSRVNGVNMAGLYGGTKAMGWKSITKPEHMTWREYANFLLSTLPEETRNNYLKKLEKSKKVWKTQGGALDEDTIEELKAEGANAVYTGTVGNRSEKQVVKFEEYPDDTTVSDFKSIPTYKRFCVCILKNDWTCKYMGFTQTKKEAQKRQSAIDKYQNLLTGGKTR